MTDSHQRLASIAVRVMHERGLEPGFSKEALRQLSSIQGAAAAPSLPDLRRLPWCSIDNDDSRDLDQLSAAEELFNGKVRVSVAIADVDGLVARGSPLDARAAQNTTSVYTAGGTFPMLPERLSTDLTSLNPGEERDALVISYTLDHNGIQTDESLQFARVYNHSKLAYNAVTAWLEGSGPLPEAAARVPGMDAQLRLQDRAAQSLQGRRHARGALELESLQTRAVFKNGQVSGLEVERHGRANQLIEELMVAANGATARFFAQHRLASLRRVVKRPKRWDRMIVYAQSFGETLPAEPDSLALENFLLSRHAADPTHFPDVSLAVVKMMGPGEYVVESPGDTAIGHFGLAVRDYTHSTAPNRRFPDLVTQRMVKSSLNGAPPAYTRAELERLASHCTEQENSADKVERQLRKSAGALLLEHRLGEEFDSVVTGVAASGTFVRCLNPPVEGRVVRGEAGLDVAQAVRVKLLGVNVERGYIDFAAV